MLKPVLFFLPLLLTVPAVAQVNAPPTINGMQRVPNSKVALAYMKPGLDLSSYRTIQLQPLSIPATARNTIPTGDRPEFGEVWILPNQSVANLQKAYDEISREELARGGLQFVTTPQAGTLVIAAEIKNIQLNAPIENLDAAPISPTFTRGVGQMTIAVALADGPSGKVVAMAEDRKVTDDRWTYSNNAGSMADARQAFREWAILLRQRLAPGTGPKSN